MTALTPNSLIFVIKIISVFAQTSFGREKRDAIDVRQTASAVPCRDGEKCTDDDYNEYYCYVDDRRWDRCCVDVDPGRCGTVVSTTAATTTTETGGGGNDSFFCATSGSYPDYYRVRCRESALATTISGRPCTAGHFCGYYNYPYQWCWLDEDRSTWDYCCYPGSSCEARGGGGGGADSENDEDDDEREPFFGCVTCKMESTGYKTKRCVQRLHGCNRKAVTKSINNYRCFDFCNQDDTTYGWCWVKPDRGAWDWCCASGEICGGGVNARSKHRLDGANTTAAAAFSCNVGSAKGYRWPMTCESSSSTESTAATPLPADYRSPKAPLQGGPLAAVILVSILVPAFCLILIRCIYLCNKADE